MNYERQIRWQQATRNKYLSHPPGDRHKILQWSALLPERDKAQLLHHWSFGMWHRILKASKRNLRTEYFYQQTWLLALCFALLLVKCKPESILETQDAQPRLPYIAPSSCILHQAPVLLWGAIDRTVAVQYYCRCWYKVKSSFHIVVSYATAIVISRFQSSDTTHANAQQMTDLSHSRELCKFGIS